MKTNQSVHSCRKHTPARTVAMLFALLLSVILALSSCTGGEGQGGLGGLGNILGNGGQEPVYTGMTIGDSPENSASVLPEHVLLSLGMSDVVLGKNENNNGGSPEQNSGSNGDAPENNSGHNGNGHGNGNGNGHGNGNVSGDMPGSEADQEDPFDQIPDGDVEAGSDNSDILLEDAKDSLEVQGAAKPIYYAQKNQDIYITVHIDNPDSFEILSFTLNGNKYSSYMFEPGSDMENLILKVNVGDVEGVQEYTIDAIKYVDGTDIKDVRMDGDKTVRAGVWTEQQPKPIINNEVINFNDISFEVSVDDALSLIKQSEGTVMAVLYDGEQILDMKPLTLGETGKVSFTGLSTNALYQYAVLAYYDALDGTGSNVYVLQTKAFYTRAILLFDNVVLGKETADYELIWADDAPDKTVTALELEHATQGTVSLDTNATSISGLLSDNEYKLTASYLNGTSTETVSITFTTAAKSVPSATLTETAVSQSEIGFALQIDDPDGIATLTRITLLCPKTGETVELPLDARDISSLLTDTAYVLEAYYTYDLNDGTGVHEASTTLNINTDPKVIPVVDLAQEAIGQENFSFSLTITDPDAIATLTRIELLSNKTEAAEIALDARELGGLLSDTLYTVRAWFIYDLGDGTGVHEEYSDLAVKTLAKTVPTYTVTEQDKGHDFISVITSETDPDNVGKITDLSVYLDGELIATSSTLDEAIFKELISNKNYRVILTYEYDLNDGNGVITKSVDTYVLTKVYFVPESVVNSTTKPVSEGEYVYIDINVINPGSAVVNSVRINGIDYQVSSTSTNEIVRVEIKHEDQFNGGLTDFVVESLTATANGETHVYPLTENNVVSVFINGRLEVEGFAITDAAGNPIEYAFPSDPAAFYIGLYDQTGYQIDRVVVRRYYNGYYDQWWYNDQYYNKDQIIVLDNGAIMVPIADRSGGFYDYEIVSISYSNDSLVKENVTVTTPMQSLLCFDSDEIIQVSSPEDLKNMGQWAYYRLTNDIDLYAPNAGWDAPEYFRGYLDGDGHTIKNMIVNSSFQNEYVYLGLFRTVSGKIVDLNLTDILIQTTLSDTADNNEWYHIQYGAIAANIENRIILDNVHVEQRVDIKTAGEQVSAIVGLLFPYSDLCYVTDTVTATGTVTVNGGPVSDQWLGQDTSTLPTPPSFDLDSTPEAFRFNVNFVTNCDTALDSIQTILVGKLPVPTRDSYMFCGWYDNADFAGFPVAMLDRLTEDVTLYAKWLYIGINESQGLAIESGKVTGIGTCTDTVLYINSPIANNAFEGCSQLTTVYLGDGVTSVGHNAFNNCSNLRFIIISGVNAQAESWNLWGWGTDPVILLDRQSNSETQKDNWYYDFDALITQDGVTYACRNNGTATVVAFDDSVASVTLALNGYEITEIAPRAFYGCKTLETVVFSDSIVKIGDDAFYNCYNIRELNLPANLTHIGSHAFYNCNKVPEIVIPGKVTFIGSYAFQDCTILEKITLSEGITTISNYAFASCINLKYVTLPSTLTEIGDYAFAYCHYNLQSIIIPEGVTKIGNGAFEHCFGLTSVSLPSTLTTIGAYAFQSIGAERFVIPQSVTYIGNYAFNTGFIYLHTDKVPTTWEQNWNSENREDCLVFGLKEFYTDAQGVTYILFSNKTAHVVGFDGEAAEIVLNVEGYTITEITNRAFYGAESLESVTIINCIKIGNEAFYSCYNLKEIVLPDTLTQIGTNAFRNCDSLTSVVIPGGVSHIGDYAFQDCNALKTVVLSEGVVTIGEGAFQSCYYLESVSLPSTLLKIGNYAFDNNWGYLREITLPDGLQEIGIYAFQGANLEHTEIPLSVTVIGEYAFTNGNIYVHSAKKPSGWSANWNGEGRSEYVIWNFKKFYTDSYGMTYALMGDKTAIPFAFDGTVTELVIGVDGYKTTSIPAGLFSHQSDLVSVVLPEGLTSIGDNAFYQCTSLKNLNLPSTLVEIGQSAFQYTAIKELILPEGLTTMGGWAFSDCSKLEKITLPGSLTVIPNHAFYNTAISQIVIPEGVTEIEDNVFFSCRNLSAITLPSTLTKIGAYAFYELSGYQTVMMPESVTDIGEYAFNNGKIYYSGAQAPEGWHYGWYEDRVIWNVSDVFTDSYGVTYIKFTDGTASIAGVNGTVSEIVLGGNSDFPVTEIPAYLLNGRNDITRVTIDASITTIGEYAFQGTRCHIAIPETVTEIGTHAFDNAYAYTVVSEKPVGWNESWNGWSGNVVWSMPTGTFYTAEDSMTYLICEDGLAHLYFYDTPSELVINGIDGYGVVVHAMNSSDNWSVYKLIIGEGVVKLENNVFQNWYYLNEVSLPSTLIEIGAYAFSGTNLNMAEIPSSVTTIGENAFTNGFMLVSLSEKPAGWNDLWYSGNSNSIYWNFEKVVTDDNGITYILTGDKLAYVCQWDGSSNSVTIGGIDGYDVVISTVFRESSIESVTLLDGVVAIAPDAFRHCYNLKSLTLPNTLVEIGSYAFYEAPIDRVTIPKSVEKIGEYAFSYGNMYPMASSKPAGWNDNWFTGDSNNVYWDLLDFVTDENGVTYMLHTDGTASVYSFSGDAEELVLHLEGYTIVEIYPNVFLGSQITSIVLPEGLIRIGSNAFNNCYYLEQINFPSSLVEIGSGAFSNCDSLTSADISEGVEKIGNNAFYSCDSLEQITLPDTLTEIGSLAFYNCDSLISVVIPGSVSYVGNQSFQDCNALKTVVLSEGVTTIGHGAFQNCYYIESVSLPSTLTKIGEWAFANNWGDLRKITLPEGLLEIGAYAFNGVSMEHTEIPLSVTVIGEYAFTNGKIYVHSAKKPGGWSANWNSENRKEYVIWNFDKFYTDSYGVTYALFNDGTAQLVAFDGSSSHVVIGLENYRITSVPSSFFSDRQNLVSVVLPEGLTSIGSHAFYGCNKLSSVTMPSTLTTIDDRAFSALSSAFTVIIPESVSSIGEYAFDSGRICYSGAQAPEGWDASWYGYDESHVIWNVSDIHTDAYGITYVKFTDGTASIAGVSGTVSNIVLGGNPDFPVTEIPAYLLSNRSDIESVIIDASIRKIGTGAFEYTGCHVYIPQTVTEIGSYALCGSYAYVQGEYATGNWATDWNGYNSYDVVWSAPVGTFSTDENGLTYLLCEDGTAHLYLFDLVVENETLTIQGIKDYDITVHGVLGENGGSVKKLIIGEGVTKIADYAFNNWYSLLEIELPSTLTEIGTGAFHGSQTQKFFIMIPATVLVIGENAFSSATIITTLEQKPEGWSDNWCYSYYNSNIFWGFEEFLTDENGVTYVLTKAKVAYAYDFDGSSSELIISGIDGYTVEIMRNAFEYRSDILKVTLLDGVTKIGANAFASCSNLTQLTLPNSLVEIDSGAFNAVPLDSPVIPASVVKIGAYTFDCEKIYPLVNSKPDGWDTYWFSGNMENVFWNMAGMITDEYGVTYMLHNDGTASVYKFDGSATDIALALDGYDIITIYPSVFANTAITSIVLPDTLTEIGGAAFANCAALESIVMPDSIIKIGDNAFMDCSNLSDITWSANLTVIGNSAFLNCAALEVVELPLGVTKIGESAFENCHALYSLTLPEGLTEIGSFAFRYCSSLTNVAIPEGVTYIGYYAFRSCYALEELTLPSTLVEISACAFEECYNLQSVYIPQSVTTVGSYAFSSGKIYVSVAQKPAGWSSDWHGHGDEYIIWNFKEIYTADDGVIYVLLNDNTAKVIGYKNVSANIVIGLDHYTVTEIASNAFYSCGNIETVTILDGVTVIGSNAFSNCYYLTQITLPSTLKTIESYAFAECERLAPVVIPGSVSQIKDYAFYSCDCLESVILCEGITVIGEWAFANNFSLHSVSLPSTLTKIGAYAFNSANLTHVMIPQAVTSIGEYAFTAGTLYAQAASKPAGWNRNWSDGRDDSVMWGVDKQYTDDQGITYVLLKDNTAIAAGYNGNAAELVIGLDNYSVEIAPNAFIRHTEIQSIIIKEGVTKIGAYAFAYCHSLFSITLPNTLTEIGEHAFVEMSGHQTVILPDSVEIIGENAFDTGRILTGKAQASEGWHEGWCGYNNDRVIWNASDIYTDSYGVTYVKFTDGTASIISVDGSSSNIVLGGVEGFPVTEIPAYLLYCRSDITAITLAPSITSIGEYAFEYTEAHIYIPATVTSIADNAFASCHAYVSVAEQPAGWSNAWAGGSNNQVVWNAPEGSLYIAEDGAVYLLCEDGIAHLYFYNANDATSCDLTLNGLDGYDVIVYGMNTSNYTVQNLIIGEGVTKISANAFENWYHLATVTLPSTLEEIGEYAFYTDSLHKFIIIMPDSVTKMGQYAFRNTTILSHHAEKPNGWHENWHSDNQVNVCWDYKELYTDAYGITYALTNSDIAYAVSYDGTATDVVIAGVNGYKTVVYGAFTSNNTIQKVTISEGIVEIGHKAFYGCSNLKEIVLPSTLKSIGSNAFESCYNLPVLILPNGLESIGSHAFANTRCHVYVPSSVTEIDSYAFSIDCHIYAAALEKPTGWEDEWNDYSVNVAWNACQGTFRAASDGTVYVIDADGQAHLYFYNKYSSTLTIHALEGYPTVVHGDAQGNWSVETLIIGEGVTKLDDNVFYNWYYLKDVTLPSTLTEIGDKAFDNCNNLTALTLPNALVKIGARAFYGVQLEEVRIPLTVTEVGEDAFTNGIIYPECRYQPNGWHDTWYTGSAANVFWAFSEFYYDENSGITYILHTDNTASVYKFDDSIENVVIDAVINGSYAVTEIASEAFYDSAIESIELPEGLIKISDRAFYNCNYLSKINFPSTLTEIGFAAFNNCDELTSVVIPEGVTKLGASAFWDCNKLKSVTLPSTLTEIAINTFYSCYTLNSVVIPEGITKIGTAAFQHCYQLTQVTLPSTLTEIGDYAFAWTGLTNVTVPASVTTLGNYAFAYSNLQTAEIPASVTHVGEFAFTSGTVCVAHEKRQSDWHKNWNGENRKDYVIWNFREFYTDSQGVVYALLGDETAIVVDYVGNQSAIDLTLTEYTVTEIYRYAFSNCSTIQSVVIPQGVTVIGSYAFEHCYSLQSVVIPEGVTVIGGNSFYNCYNLNSVTLPSTLTEIGVSAFEYCHGLPNVVIPASVTVIGNRAFVLDNYATIYVVASEKPADWDDAWAETYGEIVWGYIPA